jgi:ABC transporter substrate binding protein
MTRRIAKVQATVTVKVRRQHVARSRALIKSLSKRRRGKTRMIESGGLTSYAIYFPALFRRSADYVDRILKDEALANLPVQAPTKFKLTINLKTAKALGLTIPTALLAAADARKASSRSFPSPTSSPTSKSPMGGSG